MSYIVLARRYRPLVFGDLVAQEHVTRTLLNAIASGRISHAYLFAGPRGVGKTTTARILARAVNCRNPVGQDPCNKCTSCVEILEGRSLDVLEIDGASNRGIDEIRDLRDRVNYAPSSSRYKIYIIDEVHMLTQEAFNALLKTLEEPPSHVIFIFATTAPHKVPPTILSRCQRFDFKAVPTAEITSQLERVLQSEKIRMSPEVIRMIARKADGAMRDALSLLDQVISFCDGDYTVEAASRVLGVLDTGLFFRLSELIAKRDTLEVVRFVDHLADSGVDLEEFYSELAAHYRNMIIFKLGAKEAAAVDISAAQQERYRELAESFDLEDLVRSLQLVLNFEETIKYSAQQKISLELLLIRLTLLEKSVNIVELLSRLEAGSVDDKTTGYGKDSPGLASRLGEKKSSAVSSSSTTFREPGSGSSPPGVHAPQSAVKERVPEHQPEAAGNLSYNLETLKQNWPNIIQKIKKEKVSLGPVLASLEPEGIEEDTLVLKIDRNLKFYRDKLKADDSRRVISKTIKEFFGLDSLRIRIEAVEKNTGEPQTQVDHSTGGPSNKSFEQLCRTNPIMGKLKELFDPELLS